MPLSEKALSYYLSQIRRVEKSRAANAEKNIRRLYKALLKDLNGFLGNEYAQYSVDGKLTVSILQEKVRYAKFLEEVEKHIDNLTPKVSNEILKVVEETYTACYSGMISAVKSAKNTKAALNYLEGLPVRPEVMKRAIENPVSGLTLPDRLQKNRKDVIYDIKQQINISLMNGDRYETTAKKVAERLDISYSKATNIVRTETHRVQEGGLMDGAKDISSTIDGSGLVYTATWRTMQDERVRPQQRRHTSRGWITTFSRNGANHMIMDGVTIQVGDRFELEAGIYTECPGSSGYARHDCNCRCFLEYDLMTAEEFEAATGKKVQKTATAKTPQTTFDSMKLTGIDDDYVPDIKSTFDDLMSSYPVEGLTVKTNNDSTEFGHFRGQVKGTKRNGEACAVWSNEICINKTLHKNRSTSAKYHTANYKSRVSKLKDAERVDLATLPHEYAHAIDTAYVLAKNPELRAFANTYKVPKKISMADVIAINEFNRTVATSDSRLSKEIFDELQKEYNLTYMETIQRIDKEYGSYAAGSISEFLAEAFANMIILDVKAKTDFMKSFEKIFKRKFKKVFGG